MKVILEKVIEEKVAKLILEDDEVTVNVIYDNECISSEGGATWNNIKDDFIEIYLDSVVTSSIRDKNAEVNFLNELDKWGWD